MTKKSNTGLKIVALGCVGLTLIGGLLVVGVGFWINKTAKDIMDPSKRGEKALEILGAEDFPPNYHCVTALSIPFVGHIVALSTKSPEANSADAGESRESLGNDFFFYIDMKERGQFKDTGAFFSGENQNGNPFAGDEVGMDVQASEILERGSFNLDGQEVQYIIQRGRFKSDDFSSEGTQGLFLAKCPDNDRVRFGIWSRPNATDTDMQPSISPESLQAFLGHFQLCGK